MNIYWDTQRLITIEASAALFNRTSGLCGTLDQDPTNDFTSKDGTVHKVMLTSSMSSMNGVLFIKIIISLIRLLQRSLMLGEFQMHVKMRFEMMKQSNWYAAMKLRRLQETFAINC